MIQILKFLCSLVCRLIFSSPIHSANKNLTGSKRLFLSFTLVLLIPAAILAQEITWTGGGDGISWNDPGNWNENRVPGQNDDVIVNLDGTYTIENSGNITINRLVMGSEVGEQTFRNLSGNIDLMSESSLGPSVTLVMDAGYILGEGTLTSEGMIQTNGTNWSGINGITLVNNGLIEHNAGIFYITSAGIIENHGTIRITADENIQNSGAVGTIINFGRLEKSGGTETSNITVSIDSRPGSRIESQAGSLWISQSSSYHNTTLSSTTENAILQLQSGTHTFRGTISGEPVGQVRINANIQAHESGAAVNFGGSGLLWISSYLQGGNTLTNEGTIIMDAPNWSGVNSSTLINEGLMIHNSGIFYTTSAAVFDNRGTYRFAADENFQNSGALSTVINRGVIEKTGGDEISNITASVDARPGSRVESQIGSIWISQNSTWHDSQFDATTEQSSIQLQAGIHTLRGTISGVPVGQVRINTPLEAHESGATVDFGGSGLLWISSYFQGGHTLANEGTIIMDAASWSGINGSTLVNNGEMLHRGGIFYLTSSGVLDNRQLYRLEADVNIQNSGALGTLVNHGIIEKTVGEGISNITPTLDSRPDSRIESKSGSIWISQSSVYHDMTITAAENAEVRFQSGTHTFRGTIEGAPEGLVTINSDIVANEEQNATISFTENGLNWISSYLIEGGMLINSGLLLLNASNWSGLNNSQMINEGTVRHLSGIFYLTSSAEFINNEQFEALGNESIRRSGSAGSFVNNGTFLKESEGPYTITSIYRNSNTGTLDLLSGELLLQHDTFFETPSIRVGSNSELAFQSGTHTFTGTINPANEGIITLNSNFLAGPGGATFLFSGSGLNWTGGYLTEGTLTNAGSIRIPGGGSVGVNAATLMNSGNITLESSNFRLLSAGELRNTAEFIVDEDVNFFTSTQSPGVFTNLGLFLKKGGNGVSTIHSEFVNSETGEMRFEVGETRFTSLLEHRENALITGTGRFDIARAEFINKGITQPGISEVSLSYVGDYEPNDTTAVLNISLGSSNDDLQYSVLNVKRADYQVNFMRPGGRATLGGKLNLSYLNDFIPEPDEEFEVIRTDIEIMGGFSDLTDLVDVANDVTFYPQIRDTSLFLVVYDGIPLLSGDITADPVELQAGTSPMIQLTGNGFSPDMSVELSCVDCNEPEIFGSFNGQIGNLTPDSAEVWFDISSNRIFGTYNLNLTDPRGGSVQTEIIIEQAPLELSVHILKKSTQGDDNTGLFVIRSSRKLKTNLTVPYQLYGSAQQYVHYSTNLLGRSVTMPAGTDSLVVSILPLPFEGTARSVGLQIEYETQPPAVNKLWASMTITGSSGETPLNILNYTPERGGNVGVITMTVTGVGFTETSSITLSGGLSAQNISVNETGTKMTGLLNLIGQSTGLQDITVSNGSDEFILPSAFVIETGIYPEVHVQVFAPVRVPRTRERTYTIILHNQGNVDVRGYAAIGGLPANAEWSINESEFGIRPEDGFEWKDVASITQKGETIQISFPYVNLAAGETRSIDITTSVPTAQVMELVAAWFYN